MFIIGFGDVGSNKLFPNLIKNIDKNMNWKFLSNKNDLKLVILDVKPMEDLVDKLNEAYRRGIEIEYINDSNGFSNEKIMEIYGTHIVKQSTVITYISAPNEVHYKYIVLTAPHSNLVLVEKPIVENLEETIRIENALPMETIEKIRMVDHYIFKDAVMNLIENYPYFSSELGSLTSIDFYLLESSPIRASRTWLYDSGLIRDLSPHFLSIMFKLKEKNKDFLDISNAKITNVKKAKYEDEAIPKEYKETAKETFAKIELTVNNVQINVTIGKGVGNTRKQLILQYENGSIILDTVINEIRVFKNNIISKIYRRRVEKNHEYGEITRNILNGNFDIGLDYWKAKKELELIQETDKYPITERYPIGKMPQV